MRILSWNINGVRTLPQYHPWNSLGVFDALLDHLAADVICFQEVKSARSALSAQVAVPPSYDSFFSFPARKSGYSGVAVYTRRATLVPLNAEEGLLFPKHNQTPCPISTAYPLLSPDDPADLDLEGRALVLDLGLFVLINVYCPNDSGTPEREHFKMAYHTLLEKRVQSLINDGRQVMVVGDLNACPAVEDHCEGPLIVARASKQDSQLHPQADGNANRDAASVDHAENSGFWAPAYRRWIRDWIISDSNPNPTCARVVDIVRQFWPERKGMYTCWNTKISARASNYGTRIDFILVTPGLVPWIKAADIQPDVKGSDHCPVYVDLHDQITTPDGTVLNLHDLINPPTPRATGTGTNPPPDPPRLAARFWEEFSGKQTLLSSFFGKKKLKNDDEKLKNRTTAPTTDKLHSSTTVVPTPIHPSEYTSLDATTTTTTLEGTSSQPRTTPALDTRDIRAPQLKAVGCILKNTLNPNPSHHQRRQSNDNVHALGDNYNQSMVQGGGVARAESRSPGDSHGLRVGDGENWRGIASGQVRGLDDEQASGMEIRIGTEEVDENLMKEKENETRKGSLKRLRSDGGGLDNDASEAGLEDDQHDHHHHQSRTTRTRSPSLDISQSQSSTADVEDVNPTEPLTRKKAKRVDSESKHASDEARATPAPFSVKKDSRKDSKTTTSNKAASTASTSRSTSNGKAKVKAKASKSDGSIMSFFAPSSSSISTTTTRKQKGAVEDKATTIQNQRGGGKVEGSTKKGKRAEVEMKTETGVAALSSQEVAEIKTNGDECAMDVDLDDLDADYQLALRLSQEEQTLASSPSSTLSRSQSQSQSQWSTLFTPIETPHCTIHNEPAKEFTVNKPGPNKGKRFFVCSRPVGPGYDKGFSERPREEVDPQWKCNYFKWATDVRKEMNQRRLGQ